MSIDEGKGTTGYCDHCGALAPHVRMEIYAEARVCDFQVTGARWRCSQCATPSRDRLLRLGATSNSGKSLWACANCGKEYQTPDKVCGGCSAR